MTRFFCNARTLSALLLLAIAGVSFGLFRYGWMPTWTVFQIPAMYPPFPDMRVIQAGLLTAADGLDPYVANIHDPWGRAYNYPRIWLTIAGLAGFDHEFHFLVFTTVVLAGYFGCCLHFLRRYPSPWILAAMFSSAGIFLVETGNIDSILFMLLYLVAFASSTWLGAGLLLIGVILKIYPLFAVTAISRNLRASLALVVAAGAFLLLTLANVRQVLTATPHAPDMGYGVPCLARLISAVVHHNPNGLLISAVLLAAALALVVLRPFGFGLIDPDQDEEQTRKLFLVGASIYVMTFLLSGNYDYRLIYLMLCIPYLSRLRNRSWRILLLLCMAVAMNQLLLGAALAALVPAHLGGALGVLAKTTTFVALTGLLLLEVAAGLPLPAWKAVAERLAARTATQS